MNIQVKGKRFTANPGIPSWCMSVSGPGGWSSLLWRDDPMFVRNPPLREDLRNHILRYYFGE